MVLHLESVSLFSSLHVLIWINNFLIVSGMILKQVIKFAICQCYRTSLSIANTTLTLKSFLPILSQISHFLKKHCQRKLKNLTSWWNMLMVVLESSSSICEFYVSVETCYGSLAKNNKLPTYFSINKLNFFKLQSQVKSMKLAILQLPWFYL